MFQIKCGDPTKMVVEETNKKQNKKLKMMRV